MELDLIKDRTTWNDAASSINSNFSRLGQIIADLEVTGGSTYTHEQSVASNEWVINHNLGRHPSVTIVDSAGTQVFGDVEYNSENQITIRFSASFSGRAFLN